MTKCPNCSVSESNRDPRSLQIVRKGSFYRKSDSKHIQRFFCHSCRKTFSTATFSKCLGQKKRRLNSPLFKLLVSGVSQRGAAIILKTHRITVARKFRFLAIQAQQKRLSFQSQLPKVSFVQFDEMETFEHSKCKPLSIPLAVDGDSRRILAFEVCSMPAKGLLARISIKRYGKRADHRPLAMNKLMKSIEPHTTKTPRFLSDMKSSYPYFVKKYFKNSPHKTVKGRRGCVVGQGELKSGGFDPLFSLNHTAAMVRAHINRLFRRTWCTTKNPDQLRLHLELYAYFHNRYLTKT